LFRAASRLERSDRHRAPQLTSRRLATPLAGRNCPRCGQERGLPAGSHRRHGWRHPRKLDSREVKAMIVRVFRPTIYPGKEHEFEEFLRDTAVPLVSRQSGLVAQHVGKPRDRSSTEYVYVTV